MNRDEFQKEIKALLPLKRSSDDFREDLSKALTKYSKLLKKLDTGVTAAISDWPGHIARVDKLITGLKECVKSYYAGMHSKAFTQLRNQMLRLGSGGVFNAIELYAVDGSKDYFRGRVFENNRHKTFDDMFHIPLDKRGIVRTARYSAPGYPCLYLGSTVYACWEELQQPRFSDLMLSYFKPKREFKLFDLRFPEKEDFEDGELRNLMLRLPIIIACSVCVSDSDTKADFKPEYIVPQLLIEVIISNNRKERKTKQIEELILGVIYTSTQFDADVEFPGRVFENIAIPVLDTADTEGYCNVLSGCFALTDPTCYEYEEIRRPFEINGKNCDSLSPEERLEKNYEFSKMGVLEKRLKSAPLHQFYYIIISPEEIEIPADGGEVSVNVLSNTEWKVY